MVRQYAFAAIGAFRRVFLLSRVRPIAQTGGNWTLARFYRGTNGRSDIWGLDSVSSFLGNLKSFRVSPRMSSVMSNKEAVQKTQEKINTWLGENRIVVFAAPGCPYCLKAKNALESVGCTDYKLVNVPSEKDAPVILTLLARMTRKKPTVPKVFVNGKFIGGGNALARLRDSGQLADMVKE